MLGVILLILKIIGITLLILLGLFLFLFFCFLFVPVRYVVNASVSPQKEIMVKGRGAWLLHIIHLSFNFMGEGEPRKCKLYFLGIPIVDFLHPREKKAKHKKDKNNKNRKAKNKKNKNKNITPEMENKPADAKGKASQQTAHGEMDSFKTTEKPNKILQIVETVKKLFEKAVHIKYTITELVQNIKEKKDILLWYLDFLKDPANGAALGKGKKQLLKIWKRLKPRKLKAYLHVGTGDPETMGQLLGVFGMLIPILGDSVEFTPEFEKVVFEGTFQVKGAVSAFVFVQTVWKVLFDKDLKEFRENIMKGKPE